MAARRAVGAPPAVVIVPLGGDYLDQDLDMVARGGAVGVLGAHVGSNSTFRTDLLFLKGVTLYDTPRAPLTEMASLVAFGFVTPIVDRAFALTDIEAAAPWVRWRLRCGRGVGRWRRWCGRWTSALYRVRRMWIGAIQAARPSGDRVNTDAKDAVHLARLLR